MNKEYGHWFNEGLLENSDSQRDFVKNLFDRILSKNFSIKKIDEQSRSYLSSLESFRSHINGNVDSVQKSDYRAYLLQNKGHIISTFNKEIFNEENKNLIKNKKIIFFSFGNKKTPISSSTRDILVLYVNICEKYNELIVDIENTINISYKKSNFFQLSKLSQMIVSCHSVDSFYLENPNCINSIDVAQKILSNILNNKTRKNIIYYNFLKNRYYKYEEKKNVSLESKTYKDIVRRIKELKFYKELKSNE